MLGTTVIAGDHHGRLYVSSVTVTNSPGNNSWQDDYFWHYEILCSKS